MTSPSHNSLTTSSTLWAAALSGLIGAGGACSSPRQPLLPNPADSASADSPPKPIDSPVAQADAPSDAASGGKITSTINENLTYAQVTQMCDEAGGYTMINATCVGSNICAGFTYQNWDPGELVYHTCAAVNGCIGISCVVLPADSGKQPADILGTYNPVAGSPQQPCATCHAQWNADETVFDWTYFRFYSDPGSGRNTSNWLDLPASVQARTVAFGKLGIYANTGTPADGVAYANMQPFYKVYSRAEIERVVDYIRTTATPIEVDVTAYDPQMMMARRPTGPGRRMMLPAYNAVLR